MSASEPKVFISYRRQETAGHAGRLYDAMAARFGETNVFVDVDLAPGIDFVQRIREAIGACRVLLVVIGPRWAVISDDERQPRIADPEDFVRLEVETALRRPEVTVIPVLVAGAQMPDPDDLPEGLRPLARRNALELSDGRWRYDVGRLNATLDELLAGTTAVHEVVSPAPPVPSPARLPSTARVVIDGMLVAGAAALIARWLADPISPKGLGDTAQVATAILRRTITWGALGAGVAIWLSFVHGEARRLPQRGLLGLALGCLAGALGGVIVFVPEYLQDPDLSSGATDGISIAAFAASGALIGALLGGLWIPVSVAGGVFAGLVSGALVRLVWNQVEWDAGSSLQEALQIGIQCLLIVGLVLAALQLLGAQRRPGLAPGGEEGIAAGYRS